ncbi:MAG TPA: CBS domain-containing protein [Nitrosopumilaceae archaeon]|nr:CBS domain-containing protein [Nitrosopumilaceae archaeon]
MLLKKDGLKEIIVKRSITVKPTTSLLEARDILFKHKIRRLIVLGANNKPVGIITEKDVAKAVYSFGGKSVQSIRVGDFMSKKLITVKKNASVYDCAKLMKFKKISSVIVLTNKGELEGIITKSDLVSVFLTQATKPLKVSEIMTRKVITVTPSDSVLLVESLLINNRITRIVVQRKRRPIGIITNRNFLPAKIPHWIAESADPVELERYQRSQQLKELQRNQLSYLLPFKAVDIMTPNPITIDSNDDVSIAALLMIRHDISGLPVVRKSMLVGIITKTDIVNAIAKR